MSFAAALPWTTYISEDRSLGTEAEGLRELLDKAAAPASDDRSSEIVSRLFEALAKAGGQRWHNRVVQCLQQDIGLHDVPSH